MVGQKQRHHLSIQYPSLSRNLLSHEKRLKQQKNKQDPALNPLHQYSTMMKTLGVSSIIKFLAQVDIWRNCSPDFVMTKVPRRDCYKSVSPSIIKGNGKVQFCLSLSNNYVLRNFKKMFCFHNSTMLINIVKLAISEVMKILNLPSIDIAQYVFSAFFVKSFNHFCRSGINR